MTLAELRRGALLRFGLNPYEGEDPVLLLPLLNDLVNEAHRQAAREAKLYRRTFNPDVPAGSGGVATVSVDETVWELDRSFRAVQVLNGSTWRELYPRTEAELVDQYGPLANAASGTPHSYFEAMGYQDSAQRQLILFPGPSAAISSGLKYTAWVYPDTLSSDSDRPELPAGEHDLLIPLICWKMAEVRADPGLLQVWSRSGNEALLELRRRMERYRRGGGVRRVRIDRQSDLY